MKEERRRRGERGEEEGEGEGRGGGRGGSEGGGGGRNRCGQQSKSEHFVNLHGKASGYLFFGLFSGRLATAVLVDSGV